MRLPLRARRVLQRVFCDFTEALAPFLFSRVYFFPFSGGVLPLPELAGRRLYFIPFSRRFFPFYICGDPGCRKTGKPHI